MSNLHDIHDRAAGALMGAFIGDALGLGPHWYYDLEELRKDYGEWIGDYTDPKPGRYHDGLKAGQLSQAGFILLMMIESLVTQGEYDQVKLEQDAAPGEDADIQKLIAQCVEMVDSVRKRENALTLAGRVIPPK